LINKLDFKLKKEHQNKMMMKVNEELKKRRMEKKKVKITSPRRLPQNSGDI
jgi:mevalonate pyrophosphate decarboxylase